MNTVFLFAFFLFQQAFEVVPIVAKPAVLPVPADGIGEFARFNDIGEIWRDGANLYVIDGQSAIRRLNLETREVSTLTVRAGTGRIYRYGSPYSTSGLKGLWGDATYLYATDIGVQEVRRIRRDTGEVDTLTSFSAPFGLTGAAEGLYVANSGGRTISRMDTSTGTSETLAVLTPPFDPLPCVTGSGCINAWTPSPRSLWSDGRFVYATGLNKSIRRVDISTGEQTNLPELPFLPRSISGDGVNIYITSNSFEIGKQNLATGVYQTLQPAVGFNSVSFQGGALYAALYRVIVRIDPATGETVSIAGGGPVTTGLSLGDTWIEGGNLYSVDNPHRSIWKTNIATGEVSVFAGLYRDRFVFTDGVGTEAEFAYPRSIWGNGSQLFVGDAFGIRRIDIATSAVTTLTGGPVGPVASGPASVARIGFASGMWAIGDYLYAADPASCVIHKIHLQTGEVSTLAGGPYRPSGWVPGEGPGYVDGTGSDARFREPGDLWADGNILFVTDGDKIRTVSVQTTEVRTLATLPDTYLDSIWGDRENVYVTGTTGMWRVSRSTGQFEPLFEVGNSPTSGRRLNPGGDLWSDGRDLYALGSGTLLRLEPRPLEPAVPFQVRMSGALALNVGDAALPMSIGHVSIEAGPETPAAMVLYALRENGVIVSETSVPASPLVREGRIYASVNGSVNTGIAIANPANAPAVISFHFTDVAGRDFGAGVVTIPPHEQIARFLNEAPFLAASPFSTPIQGTFTFRSSVPVAAIALRGLTNERSEFLMTTLPVSPLSQRPSSTVILPHYAAGGGWTTEVVLVNPTDHPLLGTIDFQGTISYDIPSHSSRAFTSAESSTTTTGTVRVIPQVGGAPSAVAIFSFRKNGITVTSAGVQEAAPSKAFEVFSEGVGRFDQAATGSMGTGLAISNPGGSEITVRVDGFTIEGLPTGTFGLVTIPPQGHVSLFVHEIPWGSFDPSTRLYAGGLQRLRVSTTSESGISVIGLRARYNERGDFLITTTPALADDAAPIAGPTVFPHVVQGGGYTTEMVFLNRTVGQATQGTLKAFTQTGGPFGIRIQ